MKRIGLGITIGFKQIVKSKRRYKVIRHFFIYQGGGHANDYFVQNGAEAKIAAKDETIAVLKERIAVLEGESRELRAQVQQLIDKVAGK